MVSRPILFLMLFQAPHNSTQLYTIQQIQQIQQTQQIQQGLYALNQERQANHG